MWPLTFQLFSGLNFDYDELTPELNSVRDNFVKHCNDDPDETGNRKKRADETPDKTEVAPEAKSETTVENDYCSFNKTVSKCIIRNTCIYHYNFSMEWNFGDTGKF